MIRALFTLANCLALPAVAAPPSPAFTVRGEHGDQTLMVKVGGAARASTADAHVEVLQIADFDHDGAPDALINHNCGGNGCDEESQIVTVRAGEPVAVDVAASSDAAKAVKVRGSWLIRVDEGDAVVHYAFDGKAAIKVVSDAAPRLHPIKEIEGTSPMVAGPERTMTIDVDFDGTPDPIRCEVWERWGTLLCTLPLPKGTQTLTTGCMTFGALPTRGHGRREFSCDRTQVVHFDGTKWALSPLPR